MRLQLAPLSLLVALMCAAGLLAAPADWEFKAKAGDWWAVNVDLCQVDNKPEASCQGCCQDNGYDHGLQVTKTCACYKLTKERVAPSDDLWQYVADDAAIRHPGIKHNDQLQ